jgi:serine/threonine protein kinase
VGKNAPTVKEVFDRAHEIASDAERQAYLDQACAGHPELRRKVEALLRAHDAAGSFLEQPAVPTPVTVPPVATGAYQPGNTPPEHSFGEGETVPPLPADAAAPPGEAPGTRLGPYRLLEEIGHGGMGAVYLAEQEQPVRRQVALKLIKPGMDSAQVVARFEAERQALALMDHLNIARVLDAGATPEGRPYVVMELVRGVPVTRFCDDNRLPVRERLELFVPVCQAIQHAHQKGVIHRDIKPSNVLVTLHEGKPFPKVIDFGVAKAVERPLTDRTPETQAGAIVGTLEYMSPEQADPLVRGLDTRSDVYSLGVLLYELLTGTTPLDRARLHGTPLIEVLRLIAAEEPPRPSARVTVPGKQAAESADRRRTEPAKLARLLRGDLDWIAAKALEKDRNRRYETAAGLGQDVRRYLDDEPVEARPPSAGYRLAKFARKHRTLVAAAGGFVATLVLAVAGLAVGLLVVNDARQQADTAKVSAEKAEQRTHKALDVADAAIEGLVRTRVSLGSAEQDMLREVLREYQRFGRELGDEEQTRARAAEMQLRTANVAALAGESADAEAAYREAIRLYEALTARAPAGVDYRQQLARSHFGLGVLFEKSKKPAEAEGAFRRAAGVLEKLVADFPGKPAYRSDLADDFNDLGVVLRERHQPVAAEEVYRRAIDLGKQLVAECRDQPLYQSNLGANYGNLGNILRDQGQPAAALTWYGKAVELLDPVVARDPAATARRFLRNVHWDRANALGLLGRHADAIKDWQRAIDLEGPSDGDYLRLFQATARAELQLQALVPGPNGATSAAPFFDAARLFARAAAAAGASDEEGLQNHYSGRALKLLEQARDAGFFRNPQRIEELKKDSYLKPLLQRPEFQKFLAGLEAGKGPK